jgi:hypothetical protein
MHFEHVLESFLRKVGLIHKNGDIRPHPMEDTFLPFKISLCVVLAEVIEADIVLSVFFASHLFFVNKPERQQILYQRPIRVYRN